MAFNFSNDPPGTAAPGEPPSPLAEAVGPEPTTAAASGDVVPDAPQSAAFVRFGSCRWQEPIDKESGAAAFCTHREVKPYAGTQTFDANAWCADCQHYKLRRAPKKRERTDYY